MKSSSAKGKSLDNLLSQFAFKKSPKKGQITPLKLPSPAQNNINNSLKDKKQRQEFPEELQCFVLSKKVKMTKDFPQDPHHITKNNDELDSNIEILRNLVVMAEESEAGGSSHCPNYWILQGAYFAIEYLEYLYLADIVFQKCVFFLDYGNQNTQNNPKMILDGQSVHHLELLFPTSVRMGHCLFLNIWIGQSSFLEEEC